MLIKKNLHVLSHPPHSLAFFMHSVSMYGYYIVYSLSTKPHLLYYKHIFDTNHQPLCQNLFWLSEVHSILISSTDLYFYSYGRPHYLNYYSFAVKNVSAIRSDVWKTHLLWDNTFSHQPNNYNLYNCVTYLVMLLLVFTDIKWCLFSITFWPMFWLFSFTLKDYHIFCKLNFVKALLVFSEIT